MAWLAAIALVISIAALSAAFFLWRKVRRIQFQSVGKSMTSSPDRGAFNSMELSLEAMLEELESHGREVLKKIDRRERELRDVLSHSHAVVRQAAKEQMTLPDPGESHDSPRITTEPARRTGSASAGEKSAAVLRLAEEGLDVPAIAKRLGLGKGEVKLILDLPRSS